MRYVMFITAIVLALALVGQGDYTEAVNAQEHHCKMVERWEMTNGDSGHPNYDGRKCEGGTATAGDIR